MEACLCPRARMKQEVTFREASTKGWRRSSPISGQQAQGAGHNHPGRAGTCHRQEARRPAGGDCRAAEFGMPLQYNNFRDWGNWRCQIVPWSHLHRHGSPAAVSFRSPIREWNRTDRVRNSWSACPRAGCRYCWSTAAELALALLTLALGWWLINRLSLRLQRLMGGRR